MSDSAGPRHAFPEDHDGHPQDPDVPVEDAVEESVTDTEAVVEEPDAAGEQTRAMEPIGAPAWSETPTTAVPAVASDTPLDIPQSDTAPPTTVQRQVLHRPRPPRRLDHFPRPCAPRHSG